MSTAQYNFPPRKLTITKDMNTPVKKFQDLFKGWYRNARNAIPELPLIPELTGGIPQKDIEGRYWKLQSVPDVSLAYIKFTLINDLGEKAHLVIARQSSAFDR